MAISWAIGITPSMGAAIPHIVFSDTAAASLISALGDLGRDDRVIHLSDDLSFGPINPPDLGARRDWIRDKLRIKLHKSEWPASKIREFWDAPLSTSERRIVWVSKRAAHEYAGLLEFVWRIGDAPCDIVELDQDELTYCRPDGRIKRNLAICLGELAPQPFKDNGHWDRAVPLDAARRESYRANWLRLRDENAPLRILDEGGLVSVPITYFDDLPMSHTIDRWRKVARIVGEALMSVCDGPFRQVGELILAARVRALAEAGRLDSQGDLSQPLFSEVRLPGAERDAERTISISFAPPIRAESDWTARL